MNDQAKTKKQLVSELLEMRGKAAELEAQVASLLEKEKVLRSLYENVPLPYHSLDEDGRFLEVNRAWLETFGFSQEEVLGKWFGDFLAPHDVESFQNNFRRFKTVGQTRGIEYEMIRKNGAVVRVSLDGRIGRDKEERFERTHCVLHDITEKKVAEQALRDSEEQFRALFENSHMAIFLGAPDGRVFRANRAACEMLGRNEEEICQAGRSGVMDETDAGLREALEERSGTGKFFGELRIKRGDGSTFPAEVASVIFTDSRSEQRSIIIVRDITKRRTAEDALNRKEATLRSLLQAASVGIGLVTDRVIGWTNETFSRMVGYSSEELGGKSTRILFDSDEEFERVGKLTCADIAERGTGSIETSFRRKDGALIDVLLSSSGIVPDDLSDGVVFTAMDITDRKQSERALYEAQEEWVRTFDAVPDLVAIIDKDNLIVRANKAMAEQLGLPKEQLYGQPCFRLIHGTKNPPAFCPHVQMVRDGREHGVEMHEESLGGFFYLTASPLLDSQGELKGCVHVARNISEQKRVEETLREQERLLNTILATSPVGIGLTRDRRMLWANPAWARMYGFTSDEEYVGKSVRMLYPSEQEFERAGRILYKDLGEGRTNEADAQMMRQDGRVFHARIRMGAVDISDESKGAIAAITDVTDRKKAEKELRESREMLQIILDTIPAAVFWKDRDLVYRGANRAWLKDAGLSSSQDVVGKTDYDLSWQKDEANSYREYDRRIMQSGIPEYDIVETYSRADGSLGWARTNKVPLRDLMGNVVGILGTYADITDLKLAEQLLSKRIEFMTELMEAIPLPVFFKDANHMYVGCNNAFVQLMGLPREEIVGKSVFDVAPKDTAKIFREKDEWLFRNPGTQVYTTSIERFDGSTREVVFHKATYGQVGGQIEGIIGTILDVTDQKRSEELLIQTERLRAIADLAGGVAHNFNNLLQIVMGGIDLALIDLDMGNASEIKKTLKQVLEGAKFGAETVRRLQSFAHVRAEAQAVGGEVLDLSEIAHQATEMTKPLWKTGPDKEGRSIFLSTSLTPGCLVNGKENEMFEVLVNLIKNATEALLAGGEIHVKTYLQGDNVILQVIDTGPGISRENLKRVFEPFWSTKGVATGTGMGLAVSHGIIVRHGGTISVESGEGKGTTFSVRLPLAKESAETAKPRGEKILQSKLNVLMIDDMVPIVMLVEKILTKHGQTVFSATGGADGLDIFGNNRIDLVICDLGMPDMNGWEVGKAVRTICQEKGILKTPFILLTGWGGQALEEGKILESGVDAVVEKPLDHKKLMEVITKVVGQRSEGDFEGKEGNL